MEIIDIEKMTIKKGPSMIIPRDEMGVTIGQDGCIYAIGGFGGIDHTYLKSGEKYDIKKKMWLPISDMSIERRSMCTITLPDGIYCIGGCNVNGQKYLKSVER